MEEGVGVLERDDHRKASIHNESACHPITDIEADIVEFRSMPIADIDLLHAVGELV